MCSIGCVPPDRVSRGSVVDVDLLHFAVGSRFEYPESMGSTLSPVSSDRPDSESRGGEI